MFTTGLLRSGRLRRLTTGRLTLRPRADAGTARFQARDGRPIILRPALPADEPELIAFLMGLSARTLHLRYFTPRPELTPEAARREADRLLQAREHAVLALLDEATPARIVGVAELARRPGAPVAEAAMIVADDHQRLGIGGALSRQLADLALRHGLEAIEVETLAENRAIHRLIAASGACYTRATADGMATFQLTTERRDDR